MDPASIKKYLIPVVAVAALIVVVGLILAGGGSEGSAAKNSPNAPSAKGPMIPPGADTTDTGMTTDMPTEVPWMVLPGGLKYHDLKEGTGETVSAGQTVSAHYTGWLAVNGGKFDSSRDRREPSEFSLNGVVKGWGLGIPGMKVGGIRRLYIPAAMGYGARGSPPKIPGDSDLVFEVKLIGYQ